MNLLSAAFMKFLFTCVSGVDGNGYRNSCTAIAAHVSLANLHLYGRLLPRLASSSPRWTVAISAAREKYDALR